MAGRNWVSRVMPDCVIRAGTTADSLKLASLTARFFPYLHLTADDVFDRIQSGVAYRVLVRNEAPDDLLGFVDFEVYTPPRPRHAVVGKPPLLPQKAAKILGLCVVPELQGKGFGKKLLSDALTRAREQDCKQAVILVEESNEKAIRLYEKFGFKRHGKLQRKLWGKDVWMLTKAL